MTDTNMLRQIIDASGFKLKYIASRIGVSYPCLLKKINNETEFKATEIQTLCEVLGLDVCQKESIFFATM